MTKLELKKAILQTEIDLMDAKQAAKAANQAVADLEKALVGLRQDSLKLDKQEQMAALDVEITKEAEAIKNPPVADPVLAEPPTEGTPS